MRHSGRLHRRELRVGGMDPIASGPPCGLLSTLWGVRLRAFAVGGLIGLMAHAIYRLL